MTKKHERSILLSMKKGERTRHAVVDRALALSSQIGLDALSIGGLAKEVGLSKSGLFAHFDSKEDLQLQVLEEAVDRFVKMVVTPAFREARGEPRVRALFERWLSWATADFLPGGCVFVSLANELDDRPGPLRDFLVGSQSEWLGTLAAAARIAVEEKHFREDLNIEQFAYEFYAVMLAFNHFHRLLRDPSAEDRARRSFESLIESCH